jgi:hypothetical protein
MKMMKKFLLSLMLVIAGCFCFAKPVTVEYYEGKTFETDTNYIGKVAIKERLMDELEYRLKQYSVAITSICLCDVNDILSDEEISESDKAFFEEILKGPYVGVWISYSWGFAEWYVTDTNEVYCVRYEWIEEEK